MDQVGLEGLGVDVVESVQLQNEVERGREKGTGRREEREGEREGEKHFNKVFLTFMPRLYF